MLRPHQFQAAPFSEWRSMAARKQTGATRTNHVQALREDQLLSKAELARRAGLSALTIDRI